jgi:hypothetical protein
LKELKIDEELKNLLPPLTDDEYKKLEKNIVDKGFDINCPIMEWNGYIADGHNRYSICKKHNIEFVTAKLAYKTKEEVMKWMLDIQLGRRNLSPIQRIAVAEKYRPIYEKQAKENSMHNLKQYSDVVNLPTRNTTDKLERTSEKLAKIAGVSEKTYRMGAKILNSDNEKVKQEVLSGKTKISAGYKDITKPKENIEPDNIHSNTQNDYKVNDIVDLPQDNIKEIIADMKIPKNADDYWNFLNEVECIEANFKEPIEVAFDVLFERHNINGQITLEERNIAVDCISNLIEKMEILKERIKNTKLKGED